MNLLPKTRQPSANPRHLQSRTSFLNTDLLTGSDGQRVPSRETISSKIEPFAASLGVTPELREAYSQVADIAIEGGRALYKHDHTTGDHSLKVALLVAVAIEFVNKVGKSDDLLANLADGSKYSKGTWQKLLDPEEAYRAVLAGFLHDLGKINIPVEILDAERKLFPEEIQTMKEHDVYSFQLAVGMATGTLLESWRKYSDTELVDRRDEIRFVAPAASGAGHHTPAQILDRIGEEGIRIPIDKELNELIAELVGIFDFYEAVTSFWRRYHVAKSADEAIDLIGQISKIDAKESLPNYERELKETDTNLSSLHKLEETIGLSPELETLKNGLAEQKLKYTTKKIIAGFDLGVFRLFKKLYDRDETLLVLGFSTQETEKFKRLQRERKKGITDREGKEAYEKIKAVCAGREDLADELLLTPLTMRQASEQIKKDSNFRRLKNAFNKFKPQFISERGTKILAAALLATSLFALGSFFYAVNLTFIATMGIFGTLMMASYVLNFLPIFRHDKQYLLGMGKQIMICTAIFGILEIFAGDVTYNLALKSASFLLINGFVQSLAALNYGIKLAKHYLIDLPQLSTYYKDGTFNSAYMFLTAATRPMENLRK